MPKTTTQHTAKRGAVEGVYERKAGLWYVRYRLPITPERRAEALSKGEKPHGKLVRKSFGSEKREAIAYYRKVKVILRSGEGVVPATAKEAAMTTVEKRNDDQSKGITLGNLDRGDEERRTRRS